jgi:16S rRNA processing protein RimM
MKTSLVIGQVVKPQGVKGELKVLPLTDNPYRFLELASFFWDEALTDEVTIQSARVHEGYAYLLVKGVTDRDAAEKLRNRYLYISRAKAAKLPAGRYYIADLEGLRVVDQDGAELGQLREVMQAGGNDVSAVQGPRPFLFPALKRVILQVDIDAGVMTLDREALEEVAVFED